MLNFLFATDFDEDAPLMFDYTTLLASKLGAKVIMFHAFGSPELLGKEQKNKRGLKVMEQLHQFVEDHLISSRRSIKIEYIVDERYSYEAIPALAKDEGIDVVILGMEKGSHSFRKILGNTTLEMLLKLDCGVLVFPDGYKTDNITRIGCTTDFEFKDIALINFLREISKKLDKGTAIHCLHVFEDGKKKKAARRDMEVLHWVFDGRKGTPVHFKIEAGEVAEAIESFAINQKLDLMVMNSNHRNFIGKLIGRSDAKEVAEDIRIPLLILKDL